MKDDPKKIISCKDWDLPEIDSFETLDWNVRNVGLFCPSPPFLWTQT